MFMEVTTSVLFKDLPVTGFSKGQKYELRSFGAFEERWSVSWYPKGDGDEIADEGYCSVYLKHENLGVKYIAYSFHLKKNGQEIGDTGCLKHTFIDKQEYGYKKLAKSDDLLNGYILLKLKISSHVAHRVQHFQEIVGSIEKDIRVDIGKTSVQANAAVLRCSSPVFRTLLDTESGFIESAESSIKLKEDNEKYIEDFFKFLHAGYVLDLDIKNEAHLEKFVALITLADKYQVESLFDHLLAMIAFKPEKSDVCNRVEVLSKFKRIPRCFDLGSSLMLWTKQNLNIPERLIFMKPFIW